MYKSFIRPLLFKIDPENIHSILVSGLRLYNYLTPFRTFIKSETNNKKIYTIKDLKFRSRVGLAAGFDKGAEIFDDLADFGFGFIEIGTITPCPQIGNSKPRIFRIDKDDSLISRTGFNNPGADIIADRIKKHMIRKYRLGANINSNPSSVGNEIIRDFNLVFERLYKYVDYFTINWGSINPNDFEKVLESLKQKKEIENIEKKIFIKLPADIDENNLLNIIIIARKYCIDGFIATGPTADRSNLMYLSKKQSEKIGPGNVSGKGIHNKSKKVVKFLAENVKGEFIIIGAGGIMTAKDAVEMIQLGADLIQIYSSFIFNGPFIVDKINKAINNI